MPRLLLIEDDPPMRELLRLVLEADAHSVTALEDAESAESLLLIEPFDLIVCDEELPGMSGQDLLARLRERGVGTPFLLASGNAIELPPALGATFLRKPFPPPALAALVTRLLDKKETTPLPAELLERLQSHYLSTLPERLARALEWARRISDPDAREALRKLGHQLGGSGKSHGLPWVSEAGALLERACLCARPCPTLVPFVESLLPLIDTKPATLLGSRLYEALQKESA